MSLAAVQNLPELVYGLPSYEDDMLPRLLRLSNLREVEAASLGTRTAAGGTEDGAASTLEGAVDLPGAEARSQAPNVLQQLTINGELMQYLESYWEPCTVCMCCNSCHFC